MLSDWNSSIIVTCSNGPIFDIVTNIANAEITQIPQKTGKDPQYGKECYRAE